MVTESESSLQLTKKQEAQLAYNLDEDPEQWLVLLSNYVASHGEKSDELKYHLVNYTPEWQALVEQTKETRFADLKKMAIEKIARWNLYIKQILSDAAHLRLIRFFLRSLVTLKTKRVKEVGPRAETQKQINLILASMAQDAYTGLDKYATAHTIISSGKTIGGRRLTEDVRKFYENMENENAQHVASLIAVIIMFKGANSMQDIVNLQTFIRSNILDPLRASLETLTDSDDIERAYKRISNYSVLIDAVDINFE